MSFDLSALTGGVDISALTGGVDLGALGLDGLDIGGIDLGSIMGILGGGSSAPASKCDSSAADY
jgi:hypothetical protein